MRAKERLPRKRYSPEFKMELVRLALEKEGSVFVLRPDLPLEVDRFEKSVDKLKLLFNQGYEQATAALPHLKQWVQN